MLATMFTIRSDWKIYGLAIAVSDVARGRGPTRHLSTSKHSHARSYDADLMSLLTFPTLSRGSEHLTTVTWC